MRVRGPFILGVGFALTLGAFTPQLHATVYNGAGGTLPDRVTGGPQAEISFPIVVSGVGQNVQGINSVTLTGFSHTWAGDLNVSLIAPNGTVLEIWGPPDQDSTNLDGNYVLVESNAIQSLDDASVPLGDGDVIPSGTYATSNYLNATDPGPHGSFASLLNGPVDGTWILQVQVVNKWSHMYGGNETLTTVIRQW